MVLCGSSARRSRNDSLNSHALAATESSALRQFNQILGEGVKQTLFQGITESFIASAQFNDLLAPIQQTSVRPPNNFDVLSAPLAR